ncbi:hypothetical protein [Shewanella baltica]|uniref:hypothetical protein n=1 Tax=Shewanella baltica TaxID=62322 RepID=UPI001ED950FF|nr:hypothetical protein [Shewanella baltica]
MLGKIALSLEGHWYNNTCFGVTVEYRVMPVLTFNPDLVERLRRGAELTIAEHESYYGGGAKGYTDWPKGNY